MILEYSRGWPLGGEPHTQEQIDIFKEILAGFPEVETPQERSKREQLNRKLNDLDLAIAEPKSISNFSVHKRNSKNPMKFFVQD